MKKLLALILSAVLLIGCIGGCSPDLPTIEAGTTAETAASQPATDPAPATSAEETQPVPTEAPTAAEPSTDAPTAPPETDAPTVPPETQAPEPVSAAEAYEKAVSQLPQDYHLELSREVSRSMDGERELLVTTDEWVMDVRGAGTDEMTAAVTWKMTVENKDIAELSVTEYEIYYANGKAALIDGSTVYAAKQSAEEFLQSFPPLALLTADNYESIEWTDGSQSAVAFGDAVDTEWEWLGMDCTDVTLGEGTALLDENGRITGVEYQTEYALEGIRFTAMAEMSLSPLEKEPAVPQTDAGEVISVSSVIAVPVMDLATCFPYMSNFSASYLGLTLSYAAGMTLLKQEWLGLDYDEEGPMIYDHVYHTIYSDETESSEYELRHFAGQTKYTEDEEEIEVDMDPEAMEAAVLDCVEDAWIYPDEMSQISISDEYDCWLIEFTVNDQIADYIRGRVEEELFGDPNKLESIGARYKLGSCTGYLSIDKGSGMPMHLKINFDAGHTYQRQNYPLKYEAEWTYRVSDGDVWKMITDELRPSEEPEVPATPLFYKVTAPNGHILWLIGTIHVGDERTAHLPQEIYDALLSSDAIAVEIDVTNFEERLEADDDLMDAYQDATYYSDNSSPFDHLEDDVAEKLELAIKKYGGDIRANWLCYKVASMTSLLEQMMLELGRLQTYDRGVDNQLVEMAKANGIEVWDVEDYAEHISLLGNFSEKLQELMLEETLDYRRYASNMGTDELFEAWCRGDEAELTAEEEEEEEDEELTPEEQALVDEYNEGMMRKRNAEMVEKAQEYLAGDKTVFFAVGLAHLLDEENGLLKCLREGGYTVEQVVFAAQEP